MAQHLWMRAALLCGFLAQAAFAGSVYRPMLTLHLRVYDQVGLPGKTLQRTTEEAVRIFRRASINLLWIDCSVLFKAKQRNPACDARFSASEVMVNLLGDPPPIRESTVVGEAIRAPAGRFATYARIYSRPIRKLAGEYPELFPVLLARVIAHEVGHLLLGPSSHSEVGIMMPKLTDARTTLAGKHVFTAEEGRRLYRAVAARGAAISLDDVFGEGESFCP